MKIGLVIGTFASAPYIHLSLESRKRYYPHIPVLVSDDASPKRAELEKLCNRYKVDFISNSSHMPDHYGDLSVFVHGFQWAKQNNIDLLLKISRRFIPLFDWSKELQEAYENTGVATFSNYCTRYGFGFRTECTGFHVPTWYARGLVTEMENKLAAIDGGLFMEAYVHELSQKIMCNTSEKASLWFYENPAPPERSGYAPLNFMSTSRVEKKPNLLWHDYTHHLQYWSKALEFGLFQYKPEDFENPNR